MFEFFLNSLSRSWEKNRPDIESAMTGRLPRFFHAPDDDALTDEIPVFVFHSVDNFRFERQMQYLSENGYRTLDAEQLLEYLGNGRNHEGRLVALTFDDAMRNFWAVAYPLLKQYGFSAILFVISGIVPDDERICPSICDLGGRQTLSTTDVKERAQHLCTWPEIFGNRNARAGNVPAG